MSENAEKMTGSETGEVPKKRWSGPMGEKEKEFLEDVQGLIGFAIRNGLSFQRVMRVLHADLSHFALARNGASYEEALADGYLPMVTGYRNLTEDSFGGFEEDEIVSR